MATSTALSVGMSHRVVNNVLPWNAPASIIFSSILAKCNVGERPTIQLTYNRVNVVLFVAYGIEEVSDSILNSGTGVRASTTVASVLRFWWLLVFGSIIVSLSNCTCEVGTLCTPCAFRSSASNRK